MGAVNPVKYTAPDGVERLLRFTLGARRRIAAEFGTANIQQILQTYDFGAVPRLVYQCLFDERGKAPDITVEQFEEIFPADNDIAAEALAALISAATQGVTEKNEIEAQIKENLRSLTGSGSGLSESSASD